MSPAGRAGGRTTGAASAAATRCPVSSSSEESSGAAGPGLGGAPATTCNGADVGEALGAEEADCECDDMANAQGFRALSRVHGKESDPGAPCLEIMPTLGPNVYK